MRACPFCGFDEGWTQSNYDENTFYIQCHVCGSRGPESKTREGAEKKWNGILKNVDDVEFKSTLGENLMGAGATPGMGNAVPASTAAMTGSQQASSSAIGSGDKWGGDASIGKPAVQEQNINPYDKIGTMMAKKMNVPMTFEKGKDQSVKHVKQKDITNPKNHKYKHKVSSYSDYANLIGNKKKKKTKKS